MDKKVNYTLVGAFLILLGVTAVLIFLWLTSMKHERFTQVYVSYLREEVSGLSVQSPVRYNGVKVGYVSSIRLSKKDPQQVELVMKLEKGTPITTSTIATLMSEGITGIDYVGLKALTADAPPLKAKPGKRYPVIPSEPSFLMKLSTAVQEVTRSISDLTRDVRLVFDNQNRVALKNSLLNIEKITHSVAINSQEINHSLKSMNVLLRNSAKASDRLPRVMEQVQQALIEVKKASHSVVLSGDSFRSTMDTAKQSVAQMSRRLVPNAQSLLQRLDNLTLTLQSVSNQLEQNPGVIVRGRTPPLPGPGEK